MDAFMDTVRKYVREGRIIAGPYYLQPDWQLVSEEALIRNLLYGRAIAEELDGGSKTGWLLDNFGQISQACQIHEQFGMNGIVVWRGPAFPRRRLLGILLGIAEWNKSSMCLSVEQLQEWDASCLLSGRGTGTDYQ